MKVTRSSVRYRAQPRQSQPLSDQAVQERLKRIKAKHPRFGSPRAHALLEAELKGAGGTINHKRVERIWRMSGLQVPQRPKKRRIKPRSAGSSQEAQDQDGAGGVSASRTPRSRVEL